MGRRLPQHVATAAPDFAGDCGNSGVGGHGETGPLPEHLDGPTALAHELVLIPADHYPGLGEHTTPLQSIRAGIAINGDAEMDLVRMATSPFAGYAVYCGDAETVAGTTVDGLLAAVDDQVALSSHSRYTDAEAISAMGAAGDANALNHVRPGPSEMVAAMGAGAQDNGACYRALLSSIR